MTHYDVLGVKPSASDVEVRAAYVALARFHHPDRVPAERRREAEDRMRAINAAWHVLGDPTRRAAYDAELRSARAPGRSARPENAPSPDFVPLDDDDTDYAALLDDTPLNAVRVPRVLQVLPAALLGIAAVALCVGFVTQLAPLAALGAIALAAGLLALAAPTVFVVFRARQDELT